MPFDGFISYSHAADGRLAPAVQRGLHRLAKPWHRRRALWIFRDQTGLAVTPALWSSIQEALDSSRHFVLLASPEAARSKWVNREIEHWVATKSPNGILPVVTDGEWRWDPAAGDFTDDSTAVPPALRGVFFEEPLFLDLRWARNDLHLSLQHARFRDAIAQLAAPMHGVSKDELEGEDVRQHRRARRLSLVATAMLVMLTLVASLTGVVAVRNADRANAAAAEAGRQQRVASEQRSSAERATEESRRQQENAQVQERRAQSAAVEAQRQEQLAREQQALAREASAEAERQQTNAGRQQTIADRAAARARRQEQLAQQHRELARQAGEERKKQERIARQAGEERKKQERIAREQALLARQAAEEARRQREEAALQQRIAINRRLMERARAMIAGDPNKALALGVAAQRLHPDQQTRDQLSHLVMSTHYAGALGGVADVASVAGQAMATAGAGGTVSLWRLADSAKPVRLRTLPADGPADKTLASSPDGRTLAAFDGLATAVLWDVADPARPARIASLPGAANIVSVTFSPDGRIIATSDRGKNTTLWHLTRGNAPVPLTTLPSAHRLKFSPDGRIAVTSGETVAVWDLADRANPVQVATLGEAIVDADVEFHPKRPLVVVESLYESLRLWDLTDPAKPQKGLMSDAVSGEAKLSRMAFSPDGRMLALGDSEGTTTVWDVAYGYPSLSARLAVLPGRDGLVRSMIFSQDGRTLITSGNRRTATLWSTRGRFAQDAVAEIADLPAGQVMGLAFRPDGRSLITAGVDGTVVPWDVADPAHPVRRAPVPLHSGKVNGFTLSPDGRTLAVAGADSSVTLLDVTRPAEPVPLKRITEDGTFPHSVRFSADGRTLAIGRLDGRTTLWDLTDRTRPAKLAALTLRKTLWSVALSPDGRTMAVSEGSYLSLWDLTDRYAPVRLTESNQGYTTNSVAFSPDGRTLATATNGDGTAALWDVADPARPHRLATLPGHSTSVWWLGFSPDGRTLATAGLDSAMMLWDIAESTTPVRFATFKTPKSQARYGAFSPDGRTVAAGGTWGNLSQTVTLWDYAVPKSLGANPASHACALTGRGLTTDEWARYIPELPYRPTC